MTWTSAAKGDIDIARAVVTWIRTAREAGYMGADWLPTDADFAKSALFERLRSGKDPLPYPPPRGLACPWYALVEDPGPHYVAGSGFFGAIFGKHGDIFTPDGYLHILQNLYRIVAKLGENHYVITDAHHPGPTPWRFHLTWDPGWKLPGSPLPEPEGCWLLKNEEFTVGGAPPDMEKFADDLRRHSDNPVHGLPQRDA